MDIKRHAQFLLDKEKDKDDAKLRFRIKYADIIIAFNVGYRVIVTKWSPETQRCKSGTTNHKKQSASTINRVIQSYETAADNVFKSFEVKSTLPTAAEFRIAFNTEIGRSKTPIKADTNFYDIWDQFTSTMGANNSWSKATYTKFNSIRTHLHNYNPDISLVNLSEDDLQKFVQHLHSIELRNTTIAKNISYVRWFLRWAFSKELYTGKLHELFRPKLKGTDGNNKEVIHLTWSELQHLLTFQFPTDKPSLARVRDVFCFCCFTGLRYSDVAKLRRSDIRTQTLADGTQSAYISVVTQKTNDSLKIELNKYAQLLLDKYTDETFIGDKALPIISNPKMNEHLKEMGQLAGIDEPQRIVFFLGSDRKEEVHPKHALLTTHCGRRTFIVNALYLGISAEVVMKWTGHSDYKAMKPYIKIVDDLKVREMNKFNNF